MLWVGDVGDWRGVVCAEGGGEIGEGRSTWALWKWLGSWLCLLSLGAPRRRKGLTANITRQMINMCFQHFLLKARGPLGLGFQFCD